MNGLSFGEPVYLLAAVGIVPLVAWALRRDEHRRAAALRRFGDESLLDQFARLPSRRTRMIRAGIRLGIPALLLLALARPELGVRTGSRAQAGRDLLVLLDLSRSMTARDAGVSRLDLARQAASEVLAAVPDYRVGLMVFGGSAFLQLPLTGNHAAFQRYLSAATTDDLGDPATDLSRALDAAATTFEHEGERGYQTVLLLSDGESGSGDITGALERLRRAQIPVFALGIGTLEGAPVPADSAAAPEDWHRDNVGRIVVSRLEEGDLRRAALETGGSYAGWSTGAGRLLGVRLAQSERRVLAASGSTERVERLQWPLGLAVLALVVESFLGRRGRKAATPHRNAILMLALGCGVLACSASVRDYRRGERFYADGQYREAYQAFQQSLKSRPEPATRFAVGVAQYRLKRYRDAAESFRLTTADPTLRQRSYYNLGNAYVRASEESEDKEQLLDDAITAFEQALALEPGDSAAKWNLELALRRRDENREAGGSSGRGRSADYGRGNMNVPGYEGNPEAAVGAMAGGGYGAGEGESAEELTETQARRLLEAVEREQLSSHQGRPALRGGSGDKDW